MSKVILNWILSYDHRFSRWWVLTWALACFLPLTDSFLGIYFTVTLFFRKAVISALSGLVRIRMTSRVCRSRPQRRESEERRSGESRSTRTAADIFTLKETSYADIYSSLATPCDTTWRSKITLSFSERKRKFYKNLLRNRGRVAGISLFHVRRWFLYLLWMMKGENCMGMTWSILFKRGNKNGRKNQFSSHC